MLRARFGRKEDEDDCDKKDESGEKKTKHSIDGILGDKGKKTNKQKNPLSLDPFFPSFECRIRDTSTFTAVN